MTKFTDLETRRLWHDGTNQVNPEMVPDLFLLGVSQDKIIVDSLNEDIEIFNQMSDEPLSTTKSENESFDLSWNIPVSYLEIDLFEYLTVQLGALGLNQDAYGHRIAAEVQEIKDRGIEKLFQTLIFVVDRLKEENKVWGVGRGSSCASLALYLIGIHEVDPIKYNIPSTEFFHD